MKQLEPMIIGRTMPVMMETQCKDIRWFDIQIRSIHSHHCGSHCEPRVENVFGMDGNIFFYAVIEPGDIAIVDFFYDCYGEDMGFSLG